MANQNKIFCESSHIKGNIFKATFNVSLEEKGTPCKKMSDNFVIGGLLNVQFIANVFYCNGKYYDYSVQITPIFKDDKLEYECKLSCMEHNVKDKIIPTGVFCFFAYRSISSVQIQLFPEKITVTVECNIKKNAKFPSLYDDTDMTDIQLRAGEDGGSIFFHRTVLASHSPVMKTMFTGEWKETKEGQVNVSGMTKESLENLKKYLYLDDVPDSNSELESLLEFACRYMMTDLVQVCSTKILYNVTHENAMQYLEMAHKYKIKRMIFGILTMIKNGLIEPAFILSGW